MHPSPIKFMHERFCISLFEIVFRSFFYTLQALWDCPINGRWLNSEQTLSLLIVEVPKVLACVSFFGYFHLFCPFFFMPPAFSDLIHSPREKTGTDLRSPCRGRRHICARHQDRGVRHARCAIQGQRFFRGSALVQRTPPHSRPTTQRSTQEHLHQKLVSSSQGVAKFEGTPSPWGEGKIFPQKHGT